MPGQGIPLGDILADSGYAHRDAGAWAIPLRAAGAQLVQDLHPHDRGPKGTHDGAIISNGNLYCPQTPRPLLELGPLARTATTDQAADHDRQTSRAGPLQARPHHQRRPGRLPPGACPAAMGKIRCPLRPPSMTLDRDRPEILSPARAPAGLLPAADHHRPARGAREDRAKARLPLRGTGAVLRPPHRRRAGFSTAKDPASNNIARGWCRLMGLAPLMLWLACLLSSATSASWTPGTPARTTTPRRAAAGLPPRTRRRRRKTLTDLATAGTPP